MLEAKNLKNQILIKKIDNKTLNIKIFDVDKYYCWGTPKDLENYEN